MKIIKNNPNLKEVLLIALSFGASVLAIGSLLTLVIFTLK